MALAFLEHLGSWKPSLVYKFVDDGTVVKRTNARLYAFPAIFMVPTTKHFDGSAFSVSS